jgi:hypothetical protein
LRRPARGVGVLCLAYGAYGYFWGCWAVLFADFLRAHDLSPGAGSVRLAVLSVTAIVAMTLLSPRLEGASRRALIALALSLQGGGALLIAVFGTDLQWVAFGIAGVGTGLVDVFVNAAGQTLESRTATPVLQTVHASYGVGAAVGALATGAALTLGISFEAVLVGTTVVQVGAGLACLRAESLPPVDARSEEAAASSLSAFVRWPYLLVPAVVVLGAFFIEGSMDVWSVIYLRRTLGASDILGSSGFAAFALATSVGRLFAARLLFGMGYRRTILLSGLASSLAGLIAVTATRPSVASVGFLLLGFSVAAAAPAAFGLAGGTGRDASLAIAAMTTVGYAGFVLGPPILGWLADEFGLRATMGALLACTLVIALGGLLSRRTRPGELVGPVGRAAEPAERPSRG